MVDFKFSNKMPRYVISLTRLQMHDYLQLENGVLKLGALVTLHELEEFLSINDKKASAFFQPVFDLFASHHVRQSATVVGNLVNCSPVSDTLPIFMALGCTIKILSLITMETREANID